MQECSKSHASRLRNGDYEYLAGRVLDVGAGDDVLQIPNGTVDPYDHSLGHRDAATLPEIADETYDALHASHVIEHCSDVSVALTNWARVLKPGGYMFAAWPDYLLYEHGEWPSRHNSDHRHAATLFDIPGIPAHVWTFRKLRDLAISLGLDLIDARLTCDGYDFRRMADRSFDQTWGAACAQCTFVFRKDRKPLAERLDKNVVAAMMVNHTTNYSHLASVNMHGPAVGSVGASVPAVTPEKRRTGSAEPRTAIALRRPGAYGDIICTLNLIPLLRKANPGSLIHYYCAKHIGDDLRVLMHQAGVDEVLDCDTLDRTRYNRVVDLIGYPLHDGYPDVPMRRHLLQYFATEMGLDIGAALPALRPPRFAPAAFATLHVKAGWSKYKEWPIERWAEVVVALPEITFIQIGGPDDPLVEGVHRHAMGSVKESLALITSARLHVGIDSFPQHAAHLYGTPAVVLWGSTQWQAAGYPQNANISLGLSCQPCFREDPSVSRMPRGPCTNPPRETYDDPKPHACMAEISVQEVVSTIRAKWADTTATATAQST